MAGPSATIVRAVLASSLPHAKPRPLTRAEYNRLAALDFFRGERVELVHGIVLQMSPIGPSHSSIVVRLSEILLPRLLGRATVRIQQPFIAADESEPEPDVAVVPLGRYADRHPHSSLLIVEVAESSLGYDRETKAPLYAASGVTEYWIADVAGRALEVYRSPEAGESPGQSRYTDVRRVLPGENVIVPGFADLTIAVASLFD